MTKQLVLFGRLFNWTPRLAHAWQGLLMKSHSVKSHVRSRINEGPNGPHPWSGFSQQMNEKWTFLQMNVKLIFQSSKDFPHPHLLSLQSRTDGFFTFREIDRRDVAVVLAKSLQTLVDQSSPTTAIRLVAKLIIIVIIITIVIIVIVPLQVPTGVPREGQQHSVLAGHRLHPGHQRQPANLSKPRFFYTIIQLLH